MVAAWGRRNPLNNSSGYACCQWAARNSICGGRRAAASRALSLRATAVGGAESAVGVPRLRLRPLGAVGAFSIEEEEEADDERELPWLL